MIKDYNKQSPDNVCLLRHDIDHDINKAIEIAEIENSLGITSTYFVLHTESYYKEANFFDKALQIQGMGHEVGLHNNILTQCIKAKGKYSPEELLAKELNYLRSSGLKIYGTSAHGDTLCRELGYINYEIFKDCSPCYRPVKRGVKCIPLHTLDLVDYKLYEAYFLPIKRGLYISDGGNTWRGFAGEGDEWSPQFLTGETKIQMPEFIFNKLNTDNKMTIQLLAHPEWQGV